MVAPLVAGAIRGAAKGAAQGAKGAKSAVAGTVKGGRAALAGGKALAGRAQQAGRGVAGKAAQAGRAGRRGPRVTTGSAPGSGGRARGPGARRPGGPDLLERGRGARPHSWAQRALNEAMGRSRGSRPAASSRAPGADLGRDDDADRTRDHSDRAWAAIRRWLRNRLRRRRGPFKKIRRRIRWIVLALLLLFVLPMLTGWMGAQAATQAQQAALHLQQYCNGAGATGLGPDGVGAGGGSEESGSTGRIPPGMDLDRALATLRKVESGSYEGNYTLDNGVGATGAYQFLDDGSWGNYRGYDQAKDAPPAVQDARAREHALDVLDALDGPWEREISLGWYLGRTGAKPFMDMPDGDPRWDQPRDYFGTTPRTYLQRFRDYYAGAPGGSGSAGGDAELCGTGGAGGPTTAERQAMIDRAMTWLTASNGGPVPYCLCTDPGTYHDGWRADCSGFVSFVWQLDEPGANTVGLQEHAEQIPRDELQPGDIMLRPLGGSSGHVAVFERWDEDDPNAMWIIHQTPPHTTRERVSYDGYVADGFSPYRKTGLD